MSHAWMLKCKTAVGVLKRDYHRLWSVPAHPPKARRGRCVECKRAVSMGAAETAAPDLLNFRDLGNASTLIRQGEISKDVYRVSVTEFAASCGSPSCAPARRCSAVPAYCMKCTLYSFVCACRFLIGHTMVY